MYTGSGLHIVPVAPVFLNQVPAVGGGIDQHILRLRLHPSLDDRLQEFIFNLKFFKRQIIHINNEFVIAVLDLGDDIGEIFKLMLVDLDHTESLGIKFIDDRLDAGGLSCSGISEQQAVVGLASLHEGSGIIHQFFLLNLVAHQIREHDAVHVVDGVEDYPTLLGGSDAERLVQAEHAHAEIPVEICHRFKKALLIRGCIQLFA